LRLRHVHCLTFLENFPCVINLHLECCHKLERITNLRRLQKLFVLCCSKLQVLEGVPALRHLELQSRGRPTLPRYLQDLNLSRLDLCCDLPLLCSMALGKSTHNWDRFCHIHRVEAHADSGLNDHADCGPKFTVSYTRNPRYLETNISSALFNILGRR